MAYLRPVRIMLAANSEGLGNAIENTGPETGTISIPPAIVSPARPRSIVAARLVLSSLVVAALVIGTGLVLSVLRLAT
jgi:hypothetical protein